MAKIINSAKIVSDDWILVLSGRRPYIEIWYYPLGSEYVICLLFLI